MAEYIEREAVRDEFYQRVLEGTITSVEDTGKFLRNFHAADVAPVVHGRWIIIERTIGMKTYRCSECKDDDFWNTRFCFGYEHYCPNCGARMDGGDGNGI